MSLQVWLPLNGDLHNQGLNGNIIATAIGTLTYDNNGKIGKCYQRATTNAQSSNGIQLNTNFLNIFNTTASVAMWVKPLGTHTHYNGTLLSSGDWNQKCWAFGVNQDNTKVDVLCGNYNRFIDCVVPVNEWTHLCSTFDNGTCKIYKNGIYVGSLTGQSNFNSDATTTCVGRETYANGYFGFNGLINDVRIYDHCLSVKEVEEIAKGLILHYKLDNNGLGNPNLLRGANIVGSSTVYGWIANGSATNIENIDGQTIHYKYNLSNSKNVPSITTNTVVPCEFGKTYMYSMDLKFDKDINLGTSVPMHYWVGARNTDSITNINCNGHLSGIQTHFIQNHSGSLAANTWVTIQTTFTFPAAATEEGYDYPAIRGFVYGAVLQTAYTGEVNVWMKNCKIEEGEVATPWCPYKEDNTIYDSSGYNNNGTIVGSLEIITSSPRYSCATHIPATSSKIHISNFLTSGFGNSYSFTWWGKRSSNNPMFWGFSDGIRLNGMYLGNLWNTGDGSNNPLYKIGTTTQVSVPSVNIWHHYVMVGNGSKCYVYLDGELWAEAKTYKAISGTSIYINGWDAGTSYCSDNTDISDFRIYATVLTAEQIKELYNTSMTIDNTGNIHARELVE